MSITDEHNHSLPLLDHALEQPSAFTAAALMEDVRRSRGLNHSPVPPVCLLDFDGDLTDWLAQEGIAKPFPAWTCFHTSMLALHIEDITCGVIGRTIGGSYAVLIAEQLKAAGTRLIVGLTSAGRVAPELPIPCLVVAANAIRDEGTSYHYLPPASEVACPTPITSELEHELKTTGQPVFSGKVWTTDAPYRETKEQLTKWAEQHVLAVEMQAASLFAFGTARQMAVACVAMVSNAVDHTGEQFDTGSIGSVWEVVKAIARVSRCFLQGNSSGYEGKENGAGSVGGTGFSESADNRRLELQARFTF